MTQYWSSESNPFYAGWDEGWTPYPDGKEPAMTNPWSLLDAGQQALSTGAVSPEEAAQNVSPLLRAMGYGKHPLLHAKRRPKNALYSGDMVGENPTVNVPTQPAVYQAVETGGGRSPASAPSDPLPMTPDGFVGPPAPPREAAPPVREETALDRITPEAKGSGLTHEASLSTSTGTKDSDKGGSRSTKTGLLFMSPQEMQAAAENVNSLPDIQEQRSGIDKMNQTLAELRGQEIDPYSRPLSALLETEFGRRGAVQAYAPGAGPTSAERDAAVRAYSDKIQDNKNNLSQRIADLLGKQKAGSYTEMFYAEKLRQEEEKAAEAEKKRATDPNLKAGSNAMPVRNRAIDTIRKDFNKSTEPFSKSLAFAQEVDNLLTNTGPGKKLAAKTVETILARARGEVGNLSYYEQAGTAAPQGVLDALTNKLSVLTSSELDNATKKEILGLTAQYRNAANQAIDAYRNKHAESGEATFGSLGLTKADFMPALLGVKLAPSTTSAPPADEKMIQVITPEGQRGKIPASQWKKAEKRGFKKVSK